MMKKLVVLFAVLGLMFQTSCTSKDSKQDAEAVADYDAAEMAALEGADGGIGDDALMSAELPEEALTEEAPSVEAAPPNEIVTTETTTTVAEEGTPAEAATVESTETNTISEMAPMEPAPTETAEILPPVEPANEAPLQEAPAYAAMPDPVEEKPAPKPVASLQKVKSAPFREGKILANAIYFARPGDSLSSISQTIYGSDRTKDLKAVNPVLKRRDVRPGDKVYYNSPNRPDDEARILTWHEDNGMMPEVYVAKAGDNIREVSKKLLGYSDAWKEVWSSNDLESKGRMEEGTQIRYWTSVAMAAAPPAPEMMPQQEMAQLPPPQEPVAELPPPPMPEEMQMAQNDLPPPPPPPPMEQMAPPPPPPPPAPEMVADAPTEEAPMDEDMTLALTAVMLAAAGMAALIVVRKKRKQKEAEQNLNTHVG